MPKCMFCKQVVDSISMHYAIGLNSCTNLIAAFGNKGIRIDPNTLPCNRSGGDTLRVKNMSLCSKCNSADARAFRERLRKKHV